MTKNRIETSKGYGVNIIESYAIHMSKDELSNYKNNVELSKAILDTVFTDRPLNENEDYTFGRTSRSCFGITTHVHVFRKGER